jgi:hypothetical protein
MSSSSTDKKEKVNFSAGSSVQLSSVADPDPEPDP